MNRIVRCAAMIGVTLLVNAAATSRASAQTAPKFDRLDALGFLAGSCWKGTFTGRSVTDEHCFKWIYNGRFLRDHHIVVGDSVPYEGESTYAWDAASKQIVFWYIALPGFYSHGTVAPSDSVLLFHDNLQTADARQMRTTWRRSGPDAYIVRVEEITGGTSKVWWTMEMKRSRAAPDSAGQGTPTFHNFENVLIRPRCRDDHSRVRIVRYL